MSVVVARSMKRCWALVTLLVLSVSTVAQQEPGVDDRNLSVTIEVLQDVKVTSSEVRSDGSHGQERGTLYAAADLTINAGQQFQMVEVGLEGGCRIQFQGTQFELPSCPWLEGFRDHQDDIFKVLHEESNAD